jgi:hypothetical protein
MSGKGIGSNGYFLLLFFGIFFLVGGDEGSFSGFASFCEVRQLGAIGCFRPIIFWCTKLTWHVIIGGQKIALLCLNLVEVILILILHCTVQFTFFFSFIYYFILFFYDD